MGNDTVEKNMLLILLEYHQHHTGHSWELIWFHVPAPSEGDIQYIRQGCIATYVSGGHLSGAWEKLVYNLTKELEKIIRLSVSLANHRP